MGRKGSLEVQIQCSLSDMPFCLLKKDQSLHVKVRGHVLNALCVLPEKMKGVVVFLALMLPHQSLGAYSGGLSNEISSLLPLSMKFSFSHTSPKLKSSEASTHFFNMKYHG